MLTDESINISMKILQQQFPNIGGWTDSVIGKCFSFDANTSLNKKNNQIHNIYDSLCSKSLKRDVINQIADYSYCKEAELVINIMPVQQQRNGVDCGVFAIAFASSLAFGEDPCITTYDTTKMRDHLISCLEKNEITVFPK